METIYPFPATRSLLPTEPVYGWDAIATGIGYPEPRVTFEAQGHLATEYDLNHARHIHIRGSFPRRVSGPFLIEGNTTFFHAQGLYWTGLSVTWRGNTVKTPIWVPSPAKNTDRGAQGIYRQQITEHEQTFYWCAAIDPTTDPANGDRAIEIDVGCTMPWDGSPSSGRGDNTRLLAGTIFLDLGRPTTVNVGGQIGSEYWLSNTVVMPPTGYLHAHYPKPFLRLFDTDPVPAQFVVHPDSNVTDVRRKFYAMATINPHLHVHPQYPEDPLWQEMYGNVLLPVPFDPQVSDGFLAPRTEQPTTQFDPQGNPKWNMKYKDIAVPEPALVVGDRRMFRVADTGLGEDGQILVPAGALASLIVVTLGKGQA